MNNELNFKKNISYYGSQREDLLSIFPDGVNSVLDIGCGSGTFGRRLKQKGVAQVVGIELDPDAAQLARQNIDKVFIGDIESASFDFNKESFDVIVLADALEHLKDPWSTLRTMKEYLKKRGYFLISVPNIQYYKILCGLIFKGEFKYENEGILDIGHLRFFTLKTLRRYMHQADFKIVETKRNFSGHISWLLNKLFFNIFADFFTRQYIMLAQKNT